MSRRTVAVPVETLQALMQGLKDSTTAQAQVSMALDDLIQSVLGVDQAPATLAPVVRLDDFRRTRGGAA
ncbi:hypothetical protein ACIBQ1_51710 [Nonomuraea sp. NPDC050153]|uniref:hypothetical protein n=1 Tax=Nonomuraea sp. NPDC050153 TaxID=3364359 RepID=UPI0037B1A9EC